MPVLTVFFLLISTMTSGEVTKLRESLRALAGRAAGGDAKSLYDLSKLHERGYDSIPVDSARALALCLQSAHLGYAPAQSLVGSRYLLGQGVRRDVDSALYWTGKAAAAGDARAANNLGFLYLDGEFLPRDFGKARIWLTKAADAGLPTAQSLLADIYREGLGVTPDTVKAVELYDKAIERGLGDASARLHEMMRRKWQLLPSDSLVSLGRHYFTHSAPELGATLFRDAATAGNADALALLGYAYSGGQGVEYDYGRAVSCFLEAALRGQPAAEFFIAEMLDIFPDALGSVENESLIRSYYVGRHVPADIYTASYWYDLAGAKGVGSSRAAIRSLFPTEGK